MVARTAGRCVPRPRPEVGSGGSLGAPLVGCRHGVRQERPHPRPEASRHPESSPAWRHPAGKVGQDRCPATGGREGGRRAWDRAAERAAERVLTGRSRWTTLGAWSVARPASRTRSSASAGAPVVMRSRMRSVPVHERSTPTSQGRIRHRRWRIFRRPETRCSRVRQRGRRPATTPDPGNVPRARPPTSRRGPITGQPGTSRGDPIASVRPGESDGLARSRVRRGPGDCLTAPKSGRADEAYRRHGSASSPIP